MEVTIKTLSGSFVLSHDELAGLLQEKRLVYKQQVLSPDTDLQCTGITQGERLVMLETLPDRRPPQLQTMPAPDAAAIRTAITEEARRRGVEHTLREERPPPAATARRSLGLPAELLNAADDQLLQLLQQALDGRLLGGLRMGSSGDSAAGSGDAEDEEEQEIEPPEPSAAHIQQITDMGFSDALARKALILTRDNVQLALEWLFEHSEDAGAADPPTQEQLQRVYGRQRRAAGSAAGSIAAMAAAALGQAAAQSPDAVLSQLTEMGFDAAAAQQAIARVGPHLDMAVSLLLGQGMAAAAGAAAAGDNAAGAAPAAGVAGTAQPLPADTEEEENVLSEQGLEEDDEDEDEYEDADEDDFEEEDGLDEDGLPLQLEAALGTMGSMDLAGFGSADMEQLLQGAEIQELYGNQLLLLQGVEGPQGSSLLRLMEAPGRLQQLMAAAGRGADESDAGSDEGEEVEEEGEEEEEEDAFADAETDDAGHQMRPAAE